MSVDRAQLEALIRDLGAIPPDVRREMAPIVRKAAEPVLSQMKANASWSTRIPGAIRVTGGFGASVTGVTFRVDAKRAPHARPYEHDGAEGTFRHPVYGNRENWVSQAARPFFYRAVQQGAEQVTNAVADGVMEVAQRHGF
jgi:hypothetical protein